MKNTPQYWHNNGPGFVAILLIASLILIASLYFYSFSYVFAWEMFQPLMATLLANTNFMINLSLTMSLITYPSLVITGIGMFISEEDFSFGFFGTIFLVAIIGGIIGMVTTWIFFTLAINEMLLISAIFSIVNMIILLTLFLTLSLADLTNMTLDNWYFRLFGKAVPLNNIGTLKLKTLVTWLNLNTEKWLICHETKKVYVMNKADVISLKLTFHKENSNL